MRKSGSENWVSYINKSGFWKLVMMFFLVHLFLEFIRYQKAGRADQICISIIFSYNQGVQGKLISY